MLLFAATLRFRCRHADAVAMLRLRRWLPHALLIDMPDADTLMMFHFVFAGYYFDADIFMLPILPPPPRFRCHGHDSRAYAFRARHLSFHTPVLLPAVYIRLYGCCHMLRYYFAFDTTLLLPLYSMLIYA